MVEKIYAVLISKGKVAARVQIGTAEMDDDKRISARKYDELHREARKQPWDMGRPNRRIEMQTESGLVPNFGGYPASGIKAFVSFVPKVERQPIPLNELLIEKKMTTIGLSKLTGISSRTLEQYRSGNRGMSLENGCKIAEALNVHPSELLKEQE